MGYDMAASKSVVDVRPSNADLAFAVIPREPTQPSVLGDVKMERDSDSAGHPQQRIVRLANGL